MQDISTCRFLLQLFIRTAKIWVYYVRIQEISQADNYFNEVVSSCESILNKPELTQYTGELLPGFEKVLSAYQNRDYILAADYMETLVLAVAGMAAEELVANLPLPKVPDGYRIEYTASATATLAKQVSGKWMYLHGNGSPVSDAQLFVKRWQEAGISHYVTAGLGLGYHVALLSDNPLVTVDVYEEDETVISLAKQYTDTPAKLWERPNVRVIHDPFYRKFTQTAAELKDNEKMIVYYPSVQTIREEKLRKQMKQLFMQMDNIDRWKNHMRLNFEYNCTHVKQGIESLRERFQGKRVYLIAGGPSLEKNISLLKKRSADEIVLTVGTSLRRCLQEEIHPDYAMITDPKGAVHAQIAGICDCGVPLIILSTTFAWIARDYQGEKYIACQYGYDRAEALAEKNGWIKVDSGGSVVTTALDLCIRLSVAEIVFLGLDLAFTGGRSHHGVASSETLKNSEMVVPDIYGNLVPTAANLNSYRIWIENRIAKVRQDGQAVRFIDATEGGALIDGTEICKLAECREEGTI